VPIAWTNGGSPAINAANLNKLAVVDDVSTAGTPTGDALRAAYGSTSDVRALRFQGLPPVMASPPTVTVTNDTAPATTLTGPVLTQPGTSYTSIVCDDLTKYTPLGVGVATPVRGTGSGAITFGVGWPIGAGIMPESLTIEFLFDGAAFELALRQFSGVQYRLLVDGQYVTRLPQTLGGTGNAFGNVKVEFATRAVRHIAVELTGTGTLFLGAWFGVNDTMRAVRPATRRLAVVGDSYAAGAYSSATGSFPTYLARALGFRDWINAGAGSTGWLANGGGTNIGTRLTTDVTRHNPTDVVFALGHNDTSFTNAQITAQVQTVLAATRSALPNLRSLSVVGPLFAGSNPGVYTAMGAAIQAGCAASGATYVDTVSNPIFTGTGHVGATTGTGNSDLYIGADSTHPTDTGSVWLGTTLAHAVASALA
jgi:lysophospholipase L1-like esterase